MSKTPEIKMTVQKPMVRTCAFTSSPRVYGGVPCSQRFRLPLPWIVYFSYMGPNKRLLHGGFCGEEPTLDSTIYYPLLPNVYGEWKFCVHDCKDESLQDNIQYFWSAPFDARVFEWEGSSWLVRILSEQTISPINFFEKWETLSWQELMKKVSDFSAGQRNFGRTKYPNFKVGEFKNKMQVVSDLYARKREPAKRKI